MRAAVAAILLAQLALPLCSAAAASAPAIRLAAVILTHSRAAALRATIRAIAPLLAAHSARIPLIVSVDDNRRADRYRPASARTLARTPRRL